MSRSAVVACAAVATFAGASTAEVVLYDAAGFDAFTPGSLEGAPQFGWEGFDLGGGDPGAIAPTITGGGQSLALEVSSVPADGGIRQESRAVLTLPTAITIADWTEITISMNVTFDADGDGNRHNFYFDFDELPNQFANQRVQDPGGGSNVGMLTGGGSQPLGASGTFDLTWIFDITSGTVDTFFGANQIDNDAAITLSSLAGGTELTHFSVTNVKDFRQATFGDTFLVNDFSIKAVPTPGAVSLIGIAGLAAIRRRR